MQQNNQLTCRFRNKSWPHCHICNIMYGLIGNVKCIFQDVLILYIWLPSRNEYFKSVPVKISFQRKCVTAKLFGLGFVYGLCNIYKVLHDITAYIVSWNKLSTCKLMYNELYYSFKWNLIQNKLKYIILYRCVTTRGCNGREGNEPLQSLIVFYFRPFNLVN